MERPIPGTRRSGTVDNIRVRGGTPLRGTLRVSGAKNAALPILCSALLADGEHVFRNVPDLRDIEKALAEIEVKGARYPAHLQARVGL